MAHKDSLVEGIREIPFMDIADDHNFDEEGFVNFIRRTSVGNMFLSDDCEIKMTKIIAGSGPKLEMSAIAYQGQIKKERLEHVERMKRSNGSDEFKEYCDVSELIMENKLTSMKAALANGNDLTHAAMVDYCLDAYMNADGLFQVIMRDFWEFVKMERARGFAIRNN